MLNLLDAVKRIGGKPFVVLSGAATEVGLVSAGSVTDDLPDRPPTFYDVGKIAQRLYLQQYRAEGWIDGASLRLGNVYGGATARPNSDRGFLNSSMHAALKGEDLYYFGDGEYVRDFIHVDDVARAFVAAIEHRDQTSGETFMIGTNVGTRMRDALSVIAHEAASMTGETSRLIEVQPPQDMNSIDKRDSRIDSSRFIARTDWVPSISLRAGVRMTLEAMAASQSAARTDQSRFFQKSS
jgi:nucleoside-diphosphate-sugar epimerase